MTNISIQDRARRVKMLILDIDGVMTDGRIIYSQRGDELKFFDVQDGLGITMLHNVGILTAVITAKKSRLVKVRAKDLKMARAYQGYPQKVGPFHKLLKEFKLSPEETCFIGDDVIDIAVLKCVGLAIAVNNAHDEVKKYAHYITTRTGGRGAVREITDLILKSQNKWDLAISHYVK